MVMEPEPQPRILVVEDEKAISSIIRRLLESKFPHDVTITGNCAAAREALGSSRFDLITLDYQLPDGTGLELLEEITSAEASPPVIMVTGHGDEATAVEAFKLGATGYVVKDKRMGTLLIEEAEKALELRRALNALTEREQRLRLLTDNMVDIVTQVDANDRIMYISPSVERVTGFTQQESIGMNTVDNIQPNDRGEVTRIMREAVANRKSLVKLEGRNRHKAHGYVWIESVGHLLYDENDRYIGAIYSSRDVTDRKRSEELVEAQRDLAIALSGITDTSGILEVALTRILEATGLDAGGVYMLDNGTGALELTYSIGVSDEFAKAVAVLDASSQQIELVLAGKPTYIWLTRHAPVDPFSKKEGLRFLAAVPLQYEGEVVGCLYVASRSHDDVPDHTKRALEGLASLIGQAVGRSGLHSALLESEERYRLLYENIGTGVYTYSSDRILTEANEVASDMLGYSREELLGKPVGEIGIIHPDEFPVTKELASRLLTGESRIVNGQFRFIKKDGDTIWVDLTGSGVRDESGAVVSVINVFTDITEKKMAEAALLASEARYELLYENLGEAALIYDGNGVITSVNKVAEQKIGYSKEELIGRHILDAGIIHPEELKAAAASMARYWTEGKNVIQSQYRFVRKDGEIREVELTTAALRNADGDIVAVTCLMFDITDKEKAEEALRGSEELWRTLIETSPDGIVVTDMQGRIIALSEKAKVLGGLFDRQAEGSNALDCLPDYERVRAEEVMKSIPEVGSISNVEYDVERPDGTTIVIEVSATCVRDTKGEPQAIVSVSRDITARKHSEEELRRMNEELEGYAQTVSHDLKGPHSTLIAATDLLEDSIKVGDSRQALEELAKVIKSDAILTYGRVQDLLTLAKAGQSPVDPVDVDVGSLMDDVLTELADLIDKKGGIVDIAPDLGHIRANRLQLTQVFTNLVSNALQHGNATATRVEVGYLGQTAPGEHKYTVCDNGPGLAPGTEESIFEPFVKGMSASGTGIGLSIVERIIHAYKGEINACNNNGACFEFTLRDA